MRRRLHLLAVATLALCYYLFSRARRRAAAVPLSPVTARGYVGPDFPERADLTTGAVPAGEMDDMAHYARPDFDPDRVHLAVRDFYEATSAYRMTATVTWHRGFRLGAALAARATSAIEQLNLPGPREDSTIPLESRFATVREDVDPRDDVRAWVRTNPETGEAVFVALYGSHDGGDDAESDDSAGPRNAERFVNVAVPIPWGNVSTALHIAHAGGDPDATGVDLTTRRGERSGLYLVTPFGDVALPVEQRFAVRPAGGRDPEGAAITATQRMWLCGMPFLTIEYDAVRDDPDSDE